MSEEYRKLIPKMQELGNRNMKPELVFEGVKENSYDYLVSQSQLGVFDGCSLSWAFRYAYKLPVKETIYPGTMAGEAWHIMFEEYIKSGQTLSARKMDEIFVRKSHDIYNRNVQAGQNIYYKFSDYIDQTREQCQALTQYLEKVPALEGYTHYDTELPLLLKYSDEVWLRGYIDVVAYNEDGTVDLWDWKTTSGWKKREPSTDLQLQIFTYCFEEIFGLKVRKFGYWIFEKKPISFSKEVFEVDRDDINYQLEEFLDRFQLQANTKDFEPVDLLQQSDACTFCKFKGNICRNYKDIMV